MAGLGRRVFEPLEFLSAANVNGYLMDQAVMVFASAAERSTEIPTPTAGMHSYRADGTVVEVYNGSAWVSANSVGGTVSVNASNVTNTLTTISADNYAFLSTDQGKVLQFTSSAAPIGTVTTSTALTAGQRIDVLADGGEGFRITAGSGVTFAGAGSTATTFVLNEYEAATILCVGSNAYRIIGNITAV